MYKELEKEIENSYNHRFKSVEKRVATVVDTLVNEKKLEIDKLDLSDVKSMVNTILALETSSLQDDVENLLAQKELLERSLQKKYAQLQEAKYDVFEVLEEKLDADENALVKLHQVKLQSIDLYDILSEMVESALVTTLEKNQDGDISKTTIEVIKDITYEAIKEGSLNTIRVRKILSTILISAINVAEATPNRAEDILSSTLRGMRAGLVDSIDRFKRRIVFMPVEAKHILIEDYDTIIEDLNQTDVLFSQVVITQATQSTQSIRTILMELNKEMRYDLEELVQISKETAEVMKERFSSFAKKAVKTADNAFKSPHAQEARRMGKEVWGVARVALGSAIKSAKDAIDKK